MKTFNFVDFFTIRKRCEEDRRRLAAVERFARSSPSTSIKFHYSLSFHLTQSLSSFFSRELFSSLLSPSPHSSVESAYTSLSTLPTITHY